MVVTQEVQQSVDHKNSHLDTQRVLSLVSLQARDSGNAGGGASDMSLAGDTCVISWREDCRVPNETQRRGKHRSIEVHDWLRQHLTLRSIDRNDKIAKNSVFCFLRKAEHIGGRIFAAPLLV